MSKVNVRFVEIGFRTLKETPQKAYLHILILKL